MTFVVGYAPTDTQYVGRRHAFGQPWKGLLRKLRNMNKLFVLMDANVHGKGVRGEAGE